jgi:hypothetical protein
MYQPGFKDFYLPVRKNLTSFAVITILLLILTIANAILCALNFNKGLKQHVSKRKVLSEEEKADQLMEMPDMKNGANPGPSRMVID